MTIFAVMSAGVAGALVYSMKVSEYNLYEYTARTAAQSYLEQLRVVDYASLLRAVKDTTLDLPTMAVDMTPASDSATLESSPLRINTWVTKDIPIVTSNTGERNNRNVDNTLDSKFYVEAKNLNSSTTPYQAVEIRITVQWLPPAVKEWSKAKSATYATVRSSVP